METQNVQADKAGHYSVALGSTSSQGLPATVFASGEARWLGVQVQGQAEGPRVLLMSVPYALKALDAETIGGKPASSFVMAPASSSAAGKSAARTPGTITGSGTADFVPRFTGATTIGNSNIFETVGGNVGIATTTPAAKLDVKGTGDVRDTLTLFPKGTHPVLSIHGTALSVDHTGLVTFVSGQTFPGTGTVTSVGSGAGLTGGPITTSGTLSIKTAGVTNAMLAHPSLTVVAGDGLDGGGSVALGSSVTLSVNTQRFPQLATANTFTNLNAINVSSSSPDLALSNSGSGDGIDISLSGGVGVDVFSGGQGMHATTSGDAGVFEGGLDGSYNLGPNGGVYSESDTDANFNTATYGYEFGSTTRTQGVWGFSESPNGFGVYGEQEGTNTAGISRPAGVWGDSTARAGVLATSDQQDAIAAISADSNGGQRAGFFDNLSTSSSENVIYATGFKVGGLCTISTGGHLACNGALGVVAPVDGGARQVALTAIQATEDWFEDAGSGQLAHGEAVVNLEGTFGQTVNASIEYHVFLTPNGDCKGLYVAQKSPTSFVVRELAGGTSSIAFDYRIMAKRKGFEGIRMADKTASFRLSETPTGGAPSSTPAVKPPSPQQVRESMRRPPTISPSKNPPPQTTLRCFPLHRCLRNPCRRPGCWRGAGETS